jgi:hypothetical protein
MPEHFTKNTVEASFWGCKCNRTTMHYVHSGRRGSCQVCIKQREKEAANRKPEEPAAIQENLF